MGILSMLVKLGVDATKFETDLKRVQSLGEKFGTSFKNAVTSKLGQAFAASAIVGFAKSVVTLSDDIGDLADQMNLTTEEVQRLQILAGETGVSFEKFASVLGKVEEARIKAILGDQAAIQTFKDLGLSVAELGNKNLSTLDLSIRLSQAHEKSGRSAQTTAAMTDLYGIKLKATATALSKYQETAGKPIISDETIDTLGKTNDALDEQYRRLKALAAPNIAAGIRATADAIDFLNSKTEAEKEAARKAPAQIGAMMLGNMQGSAAALAIAAGNKPAELPPSVASKKNPPPIPETMLASMTGQKFSLGGSQDPLARIGGFTGFQSTQDSIIKQAIEQTLQLKLIAKSSATTAQVISRD
tara:strand:- start:800 stop:1873 length:1074 start_codon:yes stop_codon:yes gene_type:complete